MYHVVPNHLTVQTAAFPDLKGIFESISFNARSSLMSLFPDLKGIFESHKSIGIIAVFKVQYTSV